LPPFVVTASSSSYVSMDSYKLQNEINDVNGSRGPNNTATSDGAVRLAPFYVYANDPATFDPNTPISDYNKQNAINGVNGSHDPNSGGGFGQSLLSGAKSFLGTASGYTSYSNADAAFRSGHILGGLGWWMQGNVEFVSSALPIAKGVSSLAGVVDSAVSRLFSTSVVHFTDQAGVDAIQASGALRAGSYVALPGEVAGMSPAQVEEFLEIQPGRGALSTTIQIPKSELLIPPNGPLTSGGATQFQISMPKPPGPFVPTPPGG